MGNNETLIKSFSLHITLVLRNKYNKRYIYAIIHLNHIKTETGVRILFKILPR